MHNARWSITRKRVVYVGEWSGGWDSDALTTTVTPHVDTSSFADGDTYVIVVHSSDVRYPSHFVLDLIVQLLMTLSFFSFFFIRSLYSLWRYDWFVYHDWFAGIRLVADSQLAITISAPDIKLPFVCERQRMSISTNYFDWNNTDCSAIPFCIRSLLLLFP